MTLTVTGQASAETATRYLAPDVARGLALLGIAMANMPTAWAVVRNADYASAFGGVYGPSTWLENLAVLFQAMFVHVRGLPMFTVLLGFGVGLITLSLMRRGFPVKQARFVLWRRYLILGAIGLLHLVLLFFGDIIVQYVVGAVILIAMISMRDRALMIIAYSLLGVSSLFFTASALITFLFPTLMDIDVSSFGVGQAQSYLEYVGTSVTVRLIGLVELPLTVLVLLPLMIIGFVWARRGVITDVDSHLTLLRIWIAIAAAVILLIGLPWGLAAIGVLPHEWEQPLSMLNSGFGMFTGPGILALIALVFRGTGEKITPATRAFVALGRRSMSGYILQSAVFLLLTQPFTLNWGSTAGVLGQMGIGLLVWSITLVWALVWDLRGWPGPVEWIHRRLSYGPAGLPASYQAIPLNT